MNTQPKPNFPDPAKHYIGFFAAAAGQPGQVAVMATQATQPASFNWQELFAAILEGLQLAAAALPVVQGYRNAFGSHPVGMVGSILGQTQLAHPVTHSIVTSALTPPTA